VKTKKNRHYESAGRVCSATLEGHKSKNMIEMALLKNGIKE
jgi:hypothetical protein